NGNWDTTNINWITAGTPTNYHQRDFITLDDTLTANPTINLLISPKPSTMTVSNNTTAYSLTGVGNLTGPFTLVKQGSAKLTIANTGINNYSSNTLIEAGTIQVGN